MGSLAAASRLADGPAFAAAEARRFDASARNRWSIFPTFEARGCRRFERRPATNDRARETVSIAPLTTGRQPSVGKRSGALKPDGGS